MKQSICFLFILAFFIEKYQAQAEFVNVNGYSINVETVGIEYRKAKKPVVILESPSLGTIKDWDSIYYKIGEVAPVIRYDRPGLGESEWNEKKPTPENIAKHLFDLLKTLKVEPPYVLVGHSWGTQLVRRFANLYPKETNGLVIVDPGMRPSIMKVAFEDMNFPPEKGLKEYLDQIQIKNDQTNFTDDEWENLMAMGDWFASPDLPPTPQVPVAALLAGKDGPGPPMARTFSFDFEELNRAMYPHEMKRLINWTLDSPDGIFINADKSGHFIQHEEPELVLAAIRYVVEKSEKRSN